MKFNSLTEPFTAFPLPTLGSEARQIVVDDSGATPEIWVPYYRINKIARM